MSPATGLLGYRDGCCCLFTWETFSPVDLDTCSSRNKSKMVEHKLASFATIVRLCRLFQLYFYLCSGKTHQSKIMLFNFCHCCWDSEAILSKKCFVPVTRAELFLWKHFHHQYRDLGNRGSPASHLKKLIFFFRRKERRCEISDIESVQSTGLTAMKRPPSSRNTCRLHSSVGRA